MIPAISVAVSGLIDASTRASSAASSIVRGSTTTPSAFSQEAAASYARAAGQSGGGPTAGTDSAPASGRQPSFVPRYIPSMAEDMVMMRQAVHAYKANASVIRQLDEVTSELIDVLKVDKSS